MKSTIDNAGRLVVPKAIREAAHLEPGTEVQFRVVAGRVEIEPAPLDIELERRGKLVVAVPRRGQPTLTETDVEETIAALRNARADDEAP
jgi:AbrB family looped-hinge helix DNA binding protein